MMQPLHLINATYYSRGDGWDPAAGVSPHLPAETASLQSCPSANPSAPSTAQSDSSPARESQSSHQNTSGSVPSVNFFWTELLGYLRSQ